MGPHPDQLEHRNVFHAFEMCDAVQAESYEIDGVDCFQFCATHVTLRQVMTSKVAMIFWDTSIEKKR